MKRVMMMTAAMAALACLAAAPKYELAATAEIASFGDVTKKVNALGAMINNPIVPMLVLSSGQQSLTQAYGPFRSDSPMYLYLYVRKSGAKDGAMESCDAVPVFPSANGPAKTALAHPGCTKEADGTLHLLPGEDNPGDRWVKFSADERYCAIAPSAELAGRAIADFAKGAAARKPAAGEAPLVKLAVTEDGFATCLALQNLVKAQQLETLKAAKKDAKTAGGLLDRVAALQAAQSARQETLLKGLSGATLELDLNDRGLSADLRVAAKPGAKVLPAAGFQLPAGALDALPAGAPLFAAVNASLQGGYFTEAEFRADCTAIAQLLKDDLLPEAKKGKGAKKYAALLDELAAAADELLRAVPCPGTGDWSASALAFDAEKHPYFRSVGESANLPAEQALARTFIDRVVAALEKQWPGSHLLARDAADVVTLDWGAAIDLAAAETGVAEKNKKEVAQAKRTLTSLLGDTKTAMSATVSGTKAVSLAAKPGFKAPEGKGDAEAAIAAALPEAAKSRPAGVLYLTPYAFARDIVLPLVAKFADREDAAQCEAMVKAMPPSAPNSALAAAGWAGKDGSFRLLVRLTANEIKNLGGAFNAFTAASMSSAEDDEDDK